jgi:hypothetical protein
MGRIVDHTTLHRAAKCFMDSGKAATHDAAMDLLRRFGLTIHAGAEVARSANHQTALLTLVNVARRTLLGGIEITGLTDAPSLSPLAPGRTLSVAVREFGGQIVPQPRPDWPSAVIGDADILATTAPSWRVTWEGWRGGVIPVRHGGPLVETGAMALAPAVAAAVCAGEAFAYHAGDHPMAGRRTAGLSLWRPGADWRAADPSESALAYLPSKLWLIGLGNLGQAFAWLLVCLPYEDRARVQLLLQDFDRLAPSNDSTSLLSFLRDVGRRKTRVVAEWLDGRGFETLIEERHFGPWISRAPDEPSVAFCGGLILWSRPDSARGRRPFAAFRCTPFRRPTRPSRYGPGRSPRPMKISRTSPPIKPCGTREWINAASLNWPRVQWAFPLSG